MRRDGHKIKYSSKNLQPSGGIYLPYLSVFQCDQVPNKASYWRSRWVLCCSNLYNLITRGDGRLSVTLKFVNITEQVLDTKFIASVANAIGRMGKNLDNKTLRNKEVSEVFDYTLDECPDDKRRQNIDKKFKK